MTGYARVEGRDDSVAWVWEAKSVNGRGLDLRVRVPSGCDALDVAARELAPKHLKRGNIQLSLSLTQQNEANAPRINQALLGQIVGLCSQLQATYPQVTAPSWDGLLTIKGVIEAGSEEQSANPDREAALRAGLDGVLHALDVMRRAEGARIAGILSQQVDEIERLYRRAGELAVLRPEAQKERLRTQVAALLDASPAALNEDRLLAEVALLAVKADVREELDRLSAHVAAARDLLKSGGAVGRKLDFLTQEFNREANTLCSKAQDVELTRLGLDLKVVIDQLREQVQNIE